MDPEQERQILRRMVTLPGGPASDMKYQTLWTQLYIAYVRNLGDRGARQRLEGALFLHRRLLEAEIEHDLRQLDPRQRPAPPEPTAPAPAPASPASALAHAKAHKKRAQETRDRAVRALNGSWPDGKIPDKETLSGPRLDQKVEGWLKINDPALPFPSPSTVMRAAAVEHKSRLVMTPVAGS
jgi:hypothetical protein